MLLHDQFYNHYRQNPEGIFCLDAEGQQVTYREALIHVYQAWLSMKAEGLERGDRFAVLSENSVEFVYLYLAASLGGFVIVPLNIRLSTDQLQFIISDSGCRFLLLGDSQSHRISDFTSGLVSHFQRKANEFRVYKLKECLGQAGSASVSVAEKWASACSANPEDVVYFMYTSGTTGMPKGVVHTHSSVTANVIQLSGELLGKPNEIHLIVAPVFHAAALSITLNCIHWGCILAMCPSFEPDHVLTTMKRLPASLVILVPTMLRQLVDRASAGPQNFPQLRLIVYGGSPVAASTLTGAKRVFKCQFVQGYGLTETVSTATCLSSKDHELAFSGQPELLCSAGRPLPGTEIKILDDSGQEVETGQVGVVYVNGPQLMRGYYNREIETATALEEGWFRTNDLGYFNEAGYLFLFDRVGDMIVSGGENVYPNRVEDILMGCPGVRDAAVIGVPNPQWGEEVKAIVVTDKSSEVNEVKLHKHCKARLADFEQPKSFEFVSQLPRNASGKLMRHLLRDQYWPTGQRKVSGS